MSLAGEFKRRMHMLFHRGRFQRELDEEMRLHLDLRQEQQMARGLSAGAAQPYRKQALWQPDAA